MMMVVMVDGDDVLGWVRVEGAWWCRDKWLVVPSGVCWLIQEEVGKSDIYVCFSSVPTFFLSMYVSFIALLLSLMCDCPPTAPPFSILFLTSASVFDTPLLASTELKSLGKNIRIAERSRIDPSAQRSTRISPDDDDDEEDDRQTRANTDEKNIPRKKMLRYTHRKHTQNKQIDYYTPI